MMVAPSKIPATASSSEATLLLIITFLLGVRISHKIALFEQNVTPLTKLVKGDNRNMVRLSNIMYVCLQNVINSVINNEYSGEQNGNST